MLSCCSEKAVLRYPHRGLSRSRAAAVRLGRGRGRHWSLVTHCLGESDKEKSEFGGGELSHSSSQKEEIGADYGEVG